VSAGRNGSVSTAIRYALDGPGIESVGGRGARGSTTPVQTGPGAHPFFYKMDSFPWVQKSGRGVNHPTPSRRKLKKQYDYTFAPTLAFVACSSVTFTFTLLDSGWETLV
jgi:hypothetical protein